VNRVVGTGIAALLSLLLSACSTPPAPRCSADQKASVNDLIYFGVETPHGAVSDDDWAAFLRDGVTPRFPDGLTTWRASGQWRSADGTLTREDSHVLNLVHPGDPKTEAAIRALIGEYKARYRQEAVLRVRSEACVSL
jgi:Protein of unknown function (DUF3574)